MWPWVYLKYFSPSIFIFTTLKVLLTLNQGQIMFDANVKKPEDQWAQLSEKKKHKATILWKQTIMACRPWVPKEQDPWGWGPWLILCRLTQSTKFSVGWTPHLSLLNTRFFPEAAFLFILKTALYHSNLLIQCEQPNLASWPHQWVSQARWVSESFPRISWT